MSLWSEFLNFSSGFHVTGLFRFFPTLLNWNHEYFSSFFLFRIVNILLAYISCTGSFIVTFPYMFIMYHGQIHTHHLFSFITLPLLKMLSTAFIVLFSHKYIKYVPHIHPLPLCIALPFPLVTQPL
jgi:hypothetical protein